MLRGKKIDRICCLAAAVMLILSTLLWGTVESVRSDGAHTIGYENLLFDSSYVHTINIELDNWDELIENAASETFTDCDITIDGETYRHVGIRAKGNTSLSNVSQMDSERYSFKVEFDHYDSGVTYHGLDKLSLNNLIQDATLMKDYIAYTLMARMSVPSPECSYVMISVNGEPWGLYLAVECVEDSFLDRYGLTKGELYKPDSMSFGGGRGNGRDFDFEEFRITEDNAEDASSSEDTSTDNAPTDQSFTGGFPGMPSDGAFPGMPGGGISNLPFSTSSDMPSGSGAEADDSSASTPGEGTFAGGFPEMPFGDFSEAFSGEMPSPPQLPGGMGEFNFGSGNSDVRLIYSDDNPDSYSNIFDNAKTKITKRDKTRLIQSLKKLNAQEDLDQVVNQDEVIRYLAVHNFLCNDDSYTGMMIHNYYLYEEDGQLSIIPWDYNLAFGGFSAGSDATSVVNSPIDSPVTRGDISDRPLIAWIFDDETALNAYHEAYDSFIENNIENGWLESEIRRVSEMIRPYLENDPTAFYTTDEFDKAIDTLLAFVQKRGESIRGQLDGEIPSTTAEQSEDSSTLIDASEITISEMGSMNNGGPGGSPGGSPGGGPDTGSHDTPPGFSGSNSGTPVSDPPSGAGMDTPFSGENTSVNPDFSAQSTSEDRQWTDQMGSMPGPGGMEFPGFMPDNIQGESNSLNRTGLLYYGVFAALLILAMVITIKTKSHNS